MHRVQLLSLVRFLFSKEVSFGVLEVFDDNVDQDRGGEQRRRDQGAAVIRAGIGQQPSRVGLEHDADQQYDEPMHSIL